MNKLKTLTGVILSCVISLALFSCSDEKPKTQNSPGPESVITAFYTAWEKSDSDAFIKLTCEPMWNVEAKSANVSVDELKAQFKENYTIDSGSNVYYKILKTTEYKNTDKEFKEAYKWAKDRYNIEIEGYAVIRVAATYDSGEPVTENMEVIKYKNSWYAKNILGI